MDPLAPDQLTPNILSAQADTSLTQPQQQEEQPLISESEEARVFMYLAQTYEQMEEAARMKQVKKWKKLLNYWEGIQYGAWDEVSQLWKTPEDISEEDPASDIDPAVYAKVVNVYKAHGEILIGALTSGLPTVRFFPKDADDHEDVTTAKAFSKVADLIQKQNKARLLLIKSLYLLYNCGFVAAYNENKTDYRFGSYQTPSYEDIPIVDRSTFCPQCGAPLNQEQMPAQGIMPQGPVQCPNCGYQGAPEIADQPGSVQVQTGMQSHPKNRECIEVYGPLNVKIPFYVKDPSSTPYICLENEYPVEMVREIYPEFAEKIQPTTYMVDYEEKARISNLYGSDDPSNLCTVQRWWFRPWALNMRQGDAQMVSQLKGAFRDGVYVVIINKSFVVEIVGDNLDTHWSICENPLSESLHSQPIGSPMVPLQDIENELDNLTLETIEFGIPEVFADPKVLDFKSYQSQELRPGQVSPASAPSGRSLGEGFYEVKATTLSREVDLFAERMNSRQQFVQGTYPSIYGGVQEGGGGTAREYEMSKASALQRLSTTWLILQEWWAKVLDRSTRSFVKNMTTDEQYVRSTGSNFMNVWIKRIEMGGEVGDIEPEIAEPFPVSWAQKRDILMNLLQMKNDDIATVIRHPENASLIAQTIGFPDLYIPGDDSRNKQLFEISILIQQEPILPGMPAGPPTNPGQIGPPPGQPPPMGPPPMEPQGQSKPEGQDGKAPQLPPIQSSIPVDPQLDDHYVEAEVCKAWLRSELGLSAKQANPAGYMNVLQHMKEHLMILSELAAQEAEAQAKANESDNSNSNSNSNDITNKTSGEL